MEVCEGGHGEFVMKNDESNLGIARVQECIHSDTLKLERLETTRAGTTGETGETTMKRKKTTYKPFDAAAYLDNDAVIAEYLSAAAEDPNPEVFVAALGDVAKARGMAQIAKDAGLGRESLYKTLSAGAHPRFETINSVLHALGVKFAVVADRES
jgi:probable addiction module antidote protein